METKTLTYSSLSGFFNALLKDGFQVIAPVRKSSGKVFFQPVLRYEDIDSESVQTTFSAKSVVFPKVEELFRYRRDENGMRIDELPESVPSTVIWGLSPCDASAFDYLSAFFLRENPDPYFRKRMEQTTLISFSCSRCDESCFCTSVGSGPGDARGSDLLMTLMGPTQDSPTIYAEVLTEKGAALTALLPEAFQATALLDKTPYLAVPATHFSIGEIQERVQNAFDSAEWKHVSMGCFGCGACAFACPTCTCFDIQDEGTQDSGRRIRCWDACGQSQFTRHASGHNPRTNQTERRRQRLMHKFKYSVDNLGMLSCVGCGRCIRNCPSHLNIFENILSVTR